jgi:hypothetical protein
MNTAVHANNYKYKSIEPHLSTFFIAYFQLKDLKMNAESVDVEAVFGDGKSNINIVPEAERNDEIALSGKSLLMQCFFFFNYKFHLCSSVYCDDIHSQDPMHHSACQFAQYF